MRKQASIRSVYDFIQNKNYFRHLEKSALAPPMEKILPTPMDLITVYKSMRLFITQNACVKHP